MKRYTWILLGASLALAAAGCNKEGKAEGEGHKTATSSVEAVKSAKPAEQAAKPAPKAEAKPAEKAAGGETAKAAAKAEAKPAEGAKAAAAKGSEKKPEGAPGAPGEAKVEAAKAGAEGKPTEAAGAGGTTQEKLKQQMEERRKKLESIYELGRKHDEDSLKKLRAIMNDDKEDAGVRATAIRVLGRERVDSFVEDLKKLAKSDVQAVRIEAAITLYQWGEKKFAMPVLEQLANQGVALRRAFLIGRKDGKNIYDPQAKSFLKKVLKSDNPYSRLDAALGLYEITGDKKALKAFKDVMADTKGPYYVRIAALNYLRHLKDDPAVRKIIQMATKDPNEQVRKRAEGLLKKPAAPKAPAKKK